MKRKQLRCGRFVGRWQGPLAGGLLASDGESLVGLWFDGQRHFGSTLAPDFVEDEGRPEFETARRWLAEYFAGREPEWTPAIKLAGTDFQQRVWSALLAINPGRTITYGQLASQLGSSPRAIGSAVGRNPISLIVPCHRVIGSASSLTGYAAGLPLKRALLTLEH